MKKKLLHINSYYISRGFYFLFFEKLREAGYKIKVFVFASYKRKIEHAQAADYIEVSNDFSEFDRYIFHLKHLKVYKDFKARYPDIREYGLLHAHSLFSNGYIAYRVKREFNIPYIVVVRGTDVMCFFKKLFFLRRLGVKIMQEASAVVFISPAHQKNVYNLYLSGHERKEIDEKAMVIPNGIDPFWLEHKRREARHRQGALKLLYVGEVNRNKNLLLTCQAAQSLVEDGMDISYSIVGRISDQGVYKKLKEYPFVNYLGTMKKEQLLDVYNQNDIFVMVSHSETFGLVYAEALTQGMPLVYSKGQGFDGFYAEGYVGYAALPDSKESISGAIRRASDEYGRLADNCRNVGGEFSWDKVVESYEQLYESISG